MSEYEIKLIFITIVVIYLIFERRSNIKKYSLLFERMKNFADSNKYTIKNQVTKDFSNSVLDRNNSLFCDYGDLLPIWNYIEASKSGLNFSIFNGNFRGRSAYYTALQIKNKFYFPMVTIRKSELMKHADYYELMDDYNMKFNIGNNLDIYILKAEYEIDKTVIEKISSMRGIFSGLPLKSFQIDISKDSLTMYFMDEIINLDQFNNIINYFIDIVEKISKEKDVKNIFMSGKPIINGSNISSDSRIDKKFAFGNVYKNTFLILFKITTLVLIILSLFVIPAEELILYLIFFLTGMFGLFIFIWKMSSVKITSFHYFMLLFVVYWTLIIPRIAENYMKFGTIFDAESLNKSVLGFIIIK